MNAYPVERATKILLFPKTGGSCMTEKYKTLDGNHSFIIHAQGNN